MSKEQNMKTQEGLAEAIGSGDLDALEQFFDPKVVDHDPAPDQSPGPAGFKKFFASMREAFPDLKLAPDHVVADEDNIAVAYTLTGTHEGEFQGIAPTGRTIEARGLQIARFEDGKIVERWGSSDELGIVGRLQGG